MKNLLVISLFLFTAYAHAADPVGNFFKVTDGVYRGARPLNDDALKELSEKIGIKSIVNLQGGDLLSKFYPIIPWLEPGEKPLVIQHEKTISAQLGMGYFHAPLNSLDEVTNDEDQVINETLSFMHDKQNQPVFIHCEHGKDRTGLLVALYKIKYEHADIEEAHDEWIAKGHSKFSRIFTGELDDYFYEKVKEFN
jgi:protein tyrosine phosphatase (PTP) superfamily phosphohydrolase (DUF442 family)